MAITKRPVVPIVKTLDLDNFIEGAPDGIKPLRSGSPKVKGVQITLRLSSEQVDRITMVAKSQGLGRATYIKRAVTLQLEVDEKK